MARSRWFALLLMLVLGCTSAPSGPGTPGGAATHGAAALTVIFLDVGQGDSSLITAPTGKRVLIDGGPPEAGERLLDDLRRRGVTTLDMIILTHPHLDHLGGLAKVVRGLTVRSFLDSGFPHPSAAYTALLKALEERGVPVRQAAAGRKIDLGGDAVLTLYGPPTPYLTGTRSDVNANSVVARLTFQQATALFAGDAEPETERWLLGQGVNLSAQLLKVPHHGGRYSSTADFLRAVRPSIAVISVGAHNDYGHPTREAMGRLTAVGAQLHRTDQEGDITVGTDGQTWRLEGAAPAPQRPPVEAGGHAPPAPSAPAPAAQDNATERVASSRSQVFHLPSCAGARQIKPENLVRFPDREAALASGRRPAGDCQP